MPLVRGVEISPVRHATFYAYVSPAMSAQYGLTLPSTATGVYGAEACAASRAAVATVGVPTC